MKALLFLFNFFIICNSFASEQGLKNYRTKVISIYIQEKLAIYNSELKTASNLCKYYDQTKINPLLKSVNYTDELLEKLVDGWRYIHELKSCPEAKSLADDKIQLKESSQFNFAYDAIRSYCIAQELSLGNFRRLYNGICEKNLKNMFKELDPHCRWETIADYNGYRDSNPCVAGYKMAADILIKNENFIDDLYTFTHKVYEESQVNGKSINFWTIYKDTVNSSNSLNNRRYFLAMMNFFFSSTKSGAGFTDRFYEVSLLNDINNNLDTYSIITNFHDLKKIRDSFSGVMDIVSKNKISLIFENKSTQTFNRHNYMSMFLGCHYTMKKGRAAGARIPLLLGIAYEGKDFIGHLKNDGVDMNALKFWNYGEYYDAVMKAYKGFLRDVNRYSSSNAIGVEFCSI